MASLLRTAWCGISGRACSSLRPEWLVSNSRSSLFRHPRIASKILTSHNLVRHDRKERRNSRYNRQERVRRHIDRFHRRGPRKFRIVVPRAIIVSVSFAIWYELKILTKNRIRWTPWSGSRSASIVIGFER